MASGWTHDDAVQEQIASTINDAVAHARRSLPKGESLTRCEICDEPIPEARRAAIPGVHLCVRCQQKADERHNRLALYNRRASKDSQLR